VVGVEVFPILVEHLEREVVGVVEVEEEIEEEEIEEEEVVWQTSLWIQFFFRSAVHVCAQEEASVAVMERRG
jgi:hypothetical protein